jgi:hypothetical protein
LRPESLNAVWFALGLIGFGLVWLAYRVGQVMTEMADLKDQLERDDFPRAYHPEPHDEFGVGQW